MGRVKNRSEEESTLKLAFDELVNSEYAYGTKLRNDVSSDWCGLSVRAVIIVLTKLGLVSETPTPNCL